MKISEVVYKEIEDAKKAVTKRGNESFNQHDTIKRINAYINDTFVDRNDGIFWNLSTTRIPHFAKNIDLDTKDLYPYAVGDNSFLPNWILKMKFYAWCRENKLAITLNDLSTGLSTYGSIVWKKCYDEDKNIKLEEVNLENLYFKQTTKSIRDTNVVELHYKSETELREYDGIWENVNEIIKEGKKEKKDEFIEYEIWERWGEYEDIEKNITYRHVIGFEKGDKQIIALDEEVKPEKIPYYDFHVGRYQGTWQRVGVVERLFSLQVRVNALVNQNAQATEIASMLLLRSNDAAMNGNVLEGAVSGQIINSSDLQQIPLQNPGISTFLNEMTLIERQADKLCLTPEIVSGGSLPSGTPFRGMALMAQAARSTFEFIRQDIGESIANILLDEILPSIVKQWNREKTIEIAGDDEDLRIYDKAVKNSMMKSVILDGRILTPEIVAAIDRKIEGELDKVGRKIDIGENFFDFKYKIRINPTGESYDLGKQNDAMYNAITLFMQNPAIMNIPLFKQYLNNNGLDWWKLTQEQVDQMAQMAAASMPGQPATSPTSSGDKLTDTVMKTADELTTPK